MRTAIRMARLGTETAFEVLAKARLLEAKGKEIIHLEIGEPDFDTPQNIKEAAKKAIDNGYTHYGPSAGLPELRKTIAEYISKTRNIKVDPEEVVVTPGAKPIIFFIILTWLRPGDEVILPSPGFPIYESMVNFVGAKPVLLPLREENDFSFTIDEFKKLVSPLTKMVILNSPQNPTGGVIDEEILKGIAEIIGGDEDILILSDEVYSEIIYEGMHHSIASVPGIREQTVILDGFSKTFAMTGWRAGYGIMSKELAVHIARLQTNSNSCTATFTQIACIEALKGQQDDVKKMVAEFKKRRDVIVDGLNKIPGFSCKKPHGAFYVFPNIKETKKTSKELADYLLNEAGVAALSGTAFGAYGKGYLRFSYANSIENIKKALKKIDDAMKKL
ncbi:MAG: pyridoxal phosphate-dependent aminotransferase [Elusimicrobiota bacterium]